MILDWLMGWQQTQRLLLGLADILQMLLRICALVDGPVSAEVVATEAADMIREGRKLAKIADNVCVKLPL